MEARPVDGFIVHREHAPSAHVFGHVETGEAVTTIKTAWRLTLKRAGIVDLHFHDLRREFCCRLLESGASLHDVRAFAGHASISTTSRYPRSTPVRLAKVLEQMERDPGGQGEPATATVGIDPVLASEMRAAHHEAVDLIGSMACGDHSKHQLR